jgi:hypothetical protein
MVSVDFHKSLKSLALRRNTAKMAVMTHKKKKTDRHLAPKITLRLPARDNELLEKLAERNYRTRTAEIIRALRKHFIEEGIVNQNHE